MNSLTYTPFQQSADSAATKSQDAWQQGDMANAAVYSIFARLNYLADMISSIVILPISLIGTAFGTAQALFIMSTSKATYLNSSYELTRVRFHRLFASGVGVLSPAAGLHFKDRSIIPMVVGAGVFGVASYMVLKNPPQKLDFSLKSWQFWK